MYVKEAIDIFFEHLKYEFYQEGRYEEADRLEDLADRINKFIVWNCTGLNMTSDDAMYNDAIDNGYRQAKDEAEVVVKSYSNLLTGAISDFEDEVEWVLRKLKNEIDCL
jgi:hypothetical protein